MFAACALVIGWNIQNAGIATGTIDSVRQLGAQDESVYTREAIHMAVYGGWPTPTFLDRFVLFKPPLLMWLSGLSIKMFGVASLAIRLPAVLSGALICVLAFQISGRGRPLWAGAAATVLLLSDRLFHTLARMNMTDIVLLASLVGAFWFFSIDFTLRSRRAFWGFGVSVGLAILSKSIAGLLPFAVVGVFWLFAPRPERPTIGRVAQTALVAFAVILPWHLYQAVVHPQWFLAEYVGVQLLAFGAKPPQTSQENQILFYLSRIAYSDPELSLLSIAAIPGFAAAVRRRADLLSLLLASWLAIFGVALLIFQYRSVQYMLPLIPALAIVSARHLPALGRPLTLGILAAAFVVKAASPAAVWGLDDRSGNTLPVGAALRAYCEERRPNDLILLGAEDEFYSAVLPLQHVRYGWLDPTQFTFALQPHLHWLGITLTTDEFLSGRGEEVYGARLRSWGLRDTKPIGTAIVARDVAEMQAMVAARPGSDFLIPRGWLAPDSIRDHEVRSASRDRVLLLAKHPSADGTRRPLWTCGL